MIWVLSSFLTLLDDFLTDDNEIRSAAVGGSFEVSPAAASGVTQANIRAANIFDVWLIDAQNSQVWKEVHFSKPIFLSCPKNPKERTQFFHPSHMKPKSASYFLFFWGCQLDNIVFNKPVYFHDDTSWWWFWWFMMMVMILVRFFVLSPMHDDSNDTLDFLRWTFSLYTKHSEPNLNTDSRCPRYTHRWDDTWWSFRITSCMSASRGVET